MKIRTKLLLLLCACPLVLWNCTDILWLSEEYVSVEHKNFTLHEAKEFFNENTMQLAVTSRSMQDDGAIRLSAGEFTPDWDKAVASAKNGLMCYDMPIDCEHTYKAVMLSKENKTLTLDAVDVYQKLIVVKSRTTGEMGQYLLTLVPDIAYERQHQGEVADLFINAGDKGGFTGVAIYSIPGLDLIVRANRYINGIKEKGIFMSGTEKDMKDKVFWLKSIMRPFQLFRNPNIQSRTVAGEAEILQWAMTPGCRVEQTGFYYFLINSTGFVAHEMLDVDGDGTPDTHTEFCCGFTDPDSDPNKDICSYCMKNGCDRTCIIPDGSITSKLVDPQKLSDAAKNTVNYITATYGESAAYCNIGVAKFFKTVYEKDLLSGMLANDMIDYWNNNPLMWDPITMSEAQGLANQGNFVVAGWKNPDSLRSGHVVVVVPGEEQYSPKWGGYVPNVMDTGEDKRYDKVMISVCFGVNKKDNIVYFKYK